MVLYQNSLNEGNYLFEVSIGLILSLLEDSLIILCKEILDHSTSINEELKTKATINILTISSNYIDKLWD